MKKLKLNRNSIRFVLSKYPLIKNKAGTEVIVNLIEEAFKNTDDETAHLVRLKYFKNESVISISINNHISVPTLERILKRFVDSIILEIINKNLIKEFLEIYSLTLSL